MRGRARKSAAPPRFNGSARGDVRAGRVPLWGDRDRATTGETSARQQNLVPAFRRAAFTELTIEQNGQSVRIVSRTGDAGEAVYYLGDGELADPPAVDKVLGALEFATVERRLEGKQDKLQLGLDAPRLKVTLVMGGLTFRLAVGSDAPAPAGSAYAESDGAVVVIARDLVTELSRPFDTYRSRTLLPYLVPNWPSFRSTATGQRVDYPARMGRLGDSLRGGDGARRSRRIRSYGLSLANVRAEAFAPAPASEEALGPPPDRLRLTLTPKAPGEPRALIELGGPCPEHPLDIVAARRDPLPLKFACVPQGVRKALSPSPVEIADRHLFSLRTDEWNNRADLGRQEARAGARRDRLAHAPANRGKCRKRCGARPRA